MATQPTDGDAVKLEVRVAARPETVFAFFTEPDKMVRWHGRLAALEPRPGGIYRVAINDRTVARGEYVELEPNRRLVFTFGWDVEGHPIPPGSSTVEVVLVPDGDETIVRLTHRGLPADARVDHASGWGHYLPRLAIVAAGGDPGPDPWGAGHTIEREGQVAN